MKKILATLAILLVSATVALGASGIREDNSGIVVWVFLGLCGLIVMLQLLPAIALVAGMVMGLFGKHHDTAH